jgi:hypothetical protein
MKPASSLNVSSHLKTIPKEIADKEIIVKELTA